MHAKTLALLSAVLLLAAPACSPGESGTNDTSTSDPGSSSGGGTTGGSTSDTPTTSTTSTSGDSESLSGTTADESTSTTDVGSSSTGGSSSGGSSSGGSSSGESTGGESTGAESSTGGESTGAESTGEPGVPVSFDECREGDATMCPSEDPACLTVDGPGGFDPNGSFFVTWSYCTRECDVDADCVSAMPGGTAVPRCVPKGGNMVKVCVLDCSFGKTCPDALECSYDDTCGTRFCNCEGTGCQDNLCTGE